MAIEFREDSRQACCASKNSDCNRETSFSQMWLIACIIRKISNAFLFVHGYNVTLRMPQERTAQITMTLV